VVVTGLAAAARAEPYVPADEAIVLERLPVALYGAKRQLASLRAELERDPQNLVLAVHLARQYIGLGRAESDPRFNGYAQAALKPWWDLTEPPLNVLILRATLKQNRHDFAGALVDLSQALSHDPRSAQAWLTRATVLQVQGRYREAAESCLKLLGRTDPLIATTCLSDALSRNGKAVESYQRLRTAVAGADSTKPAIKLWSLSVLAEIADRLSDTGAAAAHFREALVLGVRDIYLLGAYADFLLDNGQVAEARDLLADETRADGLLLRLAIAEQRLGMESAHGHIDSLDARFAESRQRGDRIHLREEARFALHLRNDPRRALELAKENWQIQQEPWDARLVLEAALTAGAGEEAKPVLQWLADTHLEDSRIQALAARLREEAAP
jgi:tetratricopeptide (TPR) repeat protein